MSPRLKQVLNGAILLVGLALCVVSLWRLQRDHPLQWSATPLGIALFFALALGVLIAMAVAWQRYVLAFFAVRLSLRHSAFQTSVMMVAKYVPIFVAGFVARVTAYAPYASVKRIVFATLTELVSAMAAALVVGLACLAIVFAPATLPVIVVLAAIAVWFAPHLIGWTLRTLARLPRPSAEPAALSADPLTRRALREAPIAHLVQCIFVAAFAANAAALVAPALDAQALLAIAGAYQVAIVAGIAVVFLPGGIGAREAAFVWLASAKLGTAEALQIALVLRIAMSALDLLGGVACLLLYRDRRPGAAEPMATH